jgi:hypothetical protein
LLSEFASLSAIVVMYAFLCMTEGAKKGWRKMYEMHAAIFEHVSCYFSSYCNFMIGDLLEKKTYKMLLLYF